LGVSFRRFSRYFATHAKMLGSSREFVCESLAVKIRYPDVSFLEGRTKTPMGGCGQTQCSPTVLGTVEDIATDEASDIFYLTARGLYWTYPDFVDTLLRCGLPQRILFVLGRRSIVQVRV
jgi:hypothetical protein